jgi:hypothetical protein
MSRKKAQEFYTAIDEIVDKETFLELVREGFLEPACRSSDCHFMRSLSWSQYNY